MPNPIPDRSRRIVADRDGGRCQRCGGNATDWHHRRRRNVSLDHDPHCPCNGVSLCRTCHSWTHKHPEKAREAGLIVSAHEQEPWNVPVKLYFGDWSFNNCDGTYQMSFTGSRTSQEDPLTTQPTKETP